MYIGVYMYRCAHIYMYIHACMYMYVYLPICIYIRIYTYQNKHVYIDVYLIISMPANEPSYSKNLRDQARCENVIRVRFMKSGNLVFRFGHGHDFFKGQHITEMMCTGEHIYIYVYMYIHIYI